MRAGQQPAARVLLLQRRTAKEVAEQIGVPAKHLRRVLRGENTPMEEVRVHLPRITGVPLHKLFTPELLDRSL